MFKNLNCATADFQIFENHRIPFFSGFVINRFSENDVEIGILKKKIRAVNPLPEERIINTQSRNRKRIHRALQPYNILIFSIFIIDWNSGGVNISGA